MQEMRKKSKEIKASLKRKRRKKCKMKRKRKLRDEETRVQM